MNNDNYDSYIKELSGYYLSNQIKILHIDKYPKLKDRVMTSNTIKNYSHRDRIVRNIQQMKYTFIHKKVNNIAVCFKATVGGSSAIYAYLYSEFDPSGEPPIVHKYFCCGPTFKSQDGEYRARLLTYERFLQIQEKYAEVLAIAEKSIVDKLATGLIAFQVDFFYPDNFTESERKYEDSINALRLPIKFFILGWLRDFHSIHSGMEENHINPAYKNIIYQQSDIPVYDKIIDAIGRVELERMVERITRYYFDINRPDYIISELECGQKIFPMTAFEAIKVGDINFSIWREIFISNLCSNLVLNMISPSFPFMNNWFYIQNTHPGIFDNMATHEKYKQSDIAETISHQLRDIDKYNYIDKSRANGPITNRFMRLSKRIQKSIIYSDSAIKLTDLAVCVTSEHVGRTLRDIPSIVAKSPAQAMMTFFTQKDTFYKHIFEFIYGFYCMNTKIGIIHGDLHMNNATFFKLYTFLSLGGKPIIPKPYNIYIVRGTMYGFPHNGIFSCIIDFSRSIIGNKEILIEEFGDKFTEMYFKEQRIRMLRIMYNYFPKFMEKNHSQLEELVLSNFPLIFKIMTAIDSYVICSNINAMLLSDEHIRSGSINLHGDCTKLLNKIIHLSESLILDYLRKAMSKSISQPADIEWPNYVILAKCFDQYETTEDNIIRDNLDVTEIFNENNKIKYEIEEYSTWGPLLSIDESIKLRKKHKLPQGEGIAEWLDYKNYDESKDVNNLLDKYEQQERDIINFEPWMFV